jgi:hypothetical protein
MQSSFHISRDFIVVFLMLAAITQRDRPPPTVFAAAKVVHRWNKLLTAFEKYSAGQPNNAALVG